ncbi:MAG: CinA family protein [bacterium]|nr:CinA family protein [bacterium]
MINKQKSAIRNPQSAISQILRERKLTIGIAESCTGGLISHQFTNIPGSSDYFRGGVVAYSNEVKIKVLGVRPEVIQRFGAVSRETARAMAIGVAGLLETDSGLGVTGIAGPSGGTEEKPVGLVYIAFCLRGEVMVRQFNFTGDRRDIKNQTATEAFRLIEEELIKEIRTHE